MTEHFGTIAPKWDPKRLEIRTMSVEKTLEPLVFQVIFFLFLHILLAYTLLKLHL